MPGLSSPIAPPFRRRRQRTVSANLGPIPGAPATPNTPSPVNSATMLYSLLSWVSAGAMKFDLYFGTNAAPPLLIPTYVGTSYIPTVVPATTYYWRVMAINDGGTAIGPVWSFTTPAATDVLVLVDGLLTTVRVRSLTIRDVLNAQPNSASIEIDTGLPSARATVQIGLGSLDATRLLFGG